MELSKELRRGLRREHWTGRDYKDFGGILAGMAEEGYREFALKGTPTERPFLGVRVPRQRELAKEVLCGNWAEFIAQEPVSFEEVNVRGFVIAGLPYVEMKKYVKSQVEIIENWGNCDCFCSSLKSVRRNREDFWSYIEKFLKGGEFEVRCGLVILLTQYMEADYLQAIFDCVDQVKMREEYYIKMAVAWLLAECYTKFPEITESYLYVAELPKWVYNKTIGKICDSYRVKKEDKERLKKTRK